MQLLIDHGLADYSLLLDKAVGDAFYEGRPRSGCVAGRPRARTRAAATTRC